MAVILPNVPNMIKCIVHGTTQGNPYVNTFYAKYTGAVPDQATANAIAAGLAGVYWTNLSAVLSTLTSHVLTEAVDLSTRTSFVGTTNIVRAGSVAGANPAPSSVAMCVSWKIQARYRGGHPRMYLPFPSQLWIANGKTVIQTNLDAYNTATDAFKTGVDALVVSGVSFKLWTVRYYDQHQLLAQPQTYQVLDTVCRSRIDSMRRRTGKEVA